MIKSSRTKRRKTRQEIHLFEEIYSNCELDECASKLSEGQNIEPYEGQNINIFQKQKIPVSNYNVVFGNNDAMILP
ncbi:unnamed protein product [Macrosiphum euphorbiae]|uniref:Uncharacterized protein n=1 Tax=Macrosiphum euphorbiae TaxID=13131 RepID=A0AAV0XTA3_9HEMI|nr:unnamed protein product [Macrosiphum euphorbiae]